MNVDIKQKIIQKKCKIWKRLFIQKKPIHQSHNSIVQYVTQPTFKKYLLLQKQWESDYSEYLVKQHAVSLNVKIVDINFR